MADKTGIQWTDATFNPWWGCEKISPACAHCYAERDATTYRQNGLWGPGSARRFFSEKHWGEPLKWNKRAAAAGKPFLVFCASMADVFEDRRDLDGPRSALFDLIEQTPALTWQLLTKRPENITRLAPESWRQAWPRNAWALTTVENQEQAEKRIPELLRVPSIIHGISAEPLLGRMQLKPEWIELEPQAFGNGVKTFPRVDWVIVGGESGPDARPMHPVWARDLRDQCQAADVSFFFKQWGEWAPLDGEEWARRGLGDVEPGGKFPMRRIGKANAGRKLFGREWSQFPLTAKNAEATK